MWLSGSFGRFSNGRQWVEVVRCWARCGGSQLEHSARLAGFDRGTGSRVACTIEVVLMSVSNSGKIQEVLFRVSAVENNIDTIHDGTRLLGGGSLSGPIGSAQPEPRFAQRIVPAALGDMAGRWLNNAANSKDEEDNNESVTHCVAAIVIENHACTDT